MARLQVQAQSEILRKDPPLDLESCYGNVRKDHNPRQTMEEPNPGVSQGNKDMASAP